MKKKILGIFVCTLLIVAAVFSVAESMNIDKNEMKTDAFPNHNPMPGGTILAPGAILFQYDVEGPTLDNQCLGVEFDDTTNHFWVTGGAAGTDPNKLYKFDDSGGLVWTYDQPDHCTGWGWRDLAFDGTYLYGSATNMIDQIDPSTGLWTGTQIPSPHNPGRAIAYDPVYDYFYVANWASTINVIEAATGNPVITLPNSLSLYGLAWDDVSAGGPWLWGYSQDGSPAVQISQIDPTDGSETGVYYEGVYNAGGDMAGGACFIDDWGGKGTFVGLTQSTPDLIFGMEICDTSPPCNIQIGNIYIGTGPGVDKEKIKADIINTGGATTLTYTMTFTFTSGSIYTQGATGPWTPHTTSPAVITGSLSIGATTTEHIWIKVKGTACFELKVEAGCADPKTVNGCAGLAICS